MAELELLLRQNGAFHSELMSAFLSTGHQSFESLPDNGNDNEVRNNNRNTMNTLQTGSADITTTSTLTTTGLSTADQTAILNRNQTLDTMNIIQNRLDNVQLDTDNSNVTDNASNTTTTPTKETADLNNPKLDNNNLTTGGGASPTGINMPQMTPEMASMMPDMMTMMKDMDPSKMMGTMPPMMGSSPGDKSEMLKGMTPEADDNANEIDVERIMEEVKQVPSQLRQQLIDHVIDSISKAHLETVTPTHKKVAEANEKFARKMREGPKPDMSKMAMDPSMMWKKMVGNMVYEVTQAVRFCKKLPGFSEIHAEDQITLVKKGSFNILLNRMCLLIDHVRQDMFDPSMEMKIPKDLVVNIPMGFMIMEFFNVASQMNPLRLTDEEIGIFSATLLMWPDQASLANKSAVEKLHSLFLQSLFYEMKKNHNDHENKFARLLGVVPVFQAINQKHTMALNAMRRNEDPVMNDYPTLPQEIYCNGNGQE